MFKYKHNSQLSQCHQPICMGTTSTPQKFVSIETTTYKNRRSKFGDLGLNFVQDGLKHSLRSWWFVFGCGFCCLVYLIILLKSKQVCEGAHKMLKAGGN